MKDRNPILSFVMSLFISGLGQLYNGEWKKAILFVFLIFPIYLILGLAGVLSSFMGFVIHVILILAYKLYVAYDAYRSSKKLNPYTLKQVNKIWIYLLFGVLSYGVIWYGVQLNRNLIGYENFSIPTPSMEPSIQVGDRVLALSIKPENIQRGDVVSFIREDGQSYISRVLALENESISVSGDRVIWEDDEEVLTKTNRVVEDMYEYQNYEVELPDKKRFSICKIEKYQDRTFPEMKTSNIENFTVPEGHVYMVSDNRNNGMDSRTYGAIPLENVESVIRYIWWSNNLKRIGLTLKE